MPRGSQHLIDHGFERFDKRLVDAYTHLYKQATIEYVKAAALTIPTLTGQARASFAAAARSLGLKVGHITQQSPTSSNFSQRQALMRAGNTTARGYALGKAKVTITPHAAKWSYRNWLTSAHNNFPYLEFHDKKCT